MRVDIDQQDIANALADTRKTFDRAKAGLIASFSIAAALLGAAGHGLWRASEAIAAAAPELSFAGMSHVWHTSPQSFYLLFGSAALLVAAIAVATGIVIARRKRACALKKEALNHTLSSGRFEFVFSGEKLSIAGPLAVKKISWQNLHSVEKYKSSIVFRRKDGHYDFIPRNVIPNSNFYDLMMVKHGPLINKPCPFEAAHLAKPLAITYETARNDLDDYYAHYFRKRDGRFYLLRRLFQWRPFVPFLFLVFSALAAACSYAALLNYNTLQAIIALVFFAGAGTVFVFNTEYFRGPAHPLRKNKTWPYAQSDLVTVSLSKEGVFHARHGATDIIKWAAFSGYVESKLFGYLVIAPKHVIALPKRAFLNKAHFDDFILCAKRNIELAKKQRNDEKRGRMMRSLPDKNAAKKPDVKEQAPQKQNAAAKPAPQRSPGPSPQAAPAQIKPVQKPAPVKTAQAKPAQEKTGAATRARQQAGSVEEPVNETPAQEQAPAKSTAPQPSASTLAILNSALEKAAQLEAAEAEQKASAQPTEKKTAAE